VKLDNAHAGYNYLSQSGHGQLDQESAFFLTGYNLFMITNYTGADPEVRVTRIRVLSRRIFWHRGLTEEKPVLTRSFTFGANLGF